MLTGKMTNFGDKLWKVYHNMSVVEESLPMTLDGRQVYHEISWKCTRLIVNPGV